MARTLVIDPVDVMERGTPIVEFQIADHDGAALTLSQISTMELTLYDERAGLSGIINSRHVQNIKNANNVTIAAGGLATWSTQAADHPVLFPQRPGQEREIHLARIRVTWATGEHTFYIQFDVESQRL